LYVNLVSGFNRVPEEKGMRFFPILSRYNAGVYRHLEEQVCSEKVYYQTIIVVCVDFIHRGLFTLYFDEKSSYLLFGADCQTEVTAAGFQDL